VFLSSWIPAFAGTRQLKASLGSAQFAFKRCPLSTQTGHYYPKWNLSGASTLFDQ